MRAHLGIKTKVCKVQIEDRGKAGVDPDRSAERERERAEAQQLARAAPAEQIAETAAELRTRRVSGARRRARRLRAEAGERSEEQNHRRASLGVAHHAELSPPLFKLGERRVSLRRERAIEGCYNARSNDESSGNAKVDGSDEKRRCGGALSERKPRRGDDGGDEREARRSNAVEDHGGQQPIVVRG